MEPNLPVLPPPPPAPYHRPPPVFRSLRGLAGTLVALFATIALVDVALFAAAVRLHRLLDDVDGRRWIEDPSVAGTAVGYVGASVLHAGLVLGIAGILMAWLWRATENLGRFPNPPRRLSPGWAVGAWLVPFACWVLPKRMIDDAWRGADADGTRGRRWEEVPVPILVHAWWFFWLITLLFGMALQVSRDAETPAQLQTLLLVDLARLPFDAAAAGFAAWSVWKISERQHGAALELWRRHHRGQVPAAPVRPAVTSLPAPPWAVALPGVSSTGAGQHTPGTRP